ncbi:TEF3, partial [Symbiodinium sp. CCMP2456]
KVKVACLGLLRDLLAQATASCPRQLGLWMPKVMSSLRDAVGDARKEVKKEAESFLRNMAKELAATPEIRALADDIIASIVDSANMEKAGETLHRMANTTFLNTVDSCAFALLFPTVARAMREQAHEAKMKGVQIVGASVNLIADPVLLQPYLQELMPLLQ